MAQTETQTAAAPEETATTTEATTDETPEATSAVTATTTAEAAPEEADEAEEISYHAVEKDGQVTAIWEMQGRKHLRTIDPRSGEGKNILSLFTAEHHDE